MLNVEKFQHPSFERGRVSLLHQVGHKWQDRQMTCTLDGCSHTALVFQAVACDTTWKQFALFVDELQEKISVFVVNVLDTEFTETAVLFASEPKFWVAEEFDIFS